MKKIMTKDEMKVLLKQGTATIKFTKVDGTERVMKCTLKDGIIPIVENVETIEMSTKSKKENPSILSVWDIEANGWRSFKIDSIKEWDFTA